MVFNSLARLFQKVFLSRILSNNLGFQVLSPGEITNKGYFQYAKFRGGGGGQTRGIMGDVQMVKVHVVVGTALLTSFYLVGTE